MIAVGHRALADEEAQQVGAALDRQGHFRILDARLARQHESEGERDAGRVHHAVAEKAAIRHGEPVPPGTDAALSLGGLERDPPQARQNRFVAGRQYVFREKHGDIAIPPRLVSALRIRRRPLRFLFDDGKVFRIAGGQQAERVEGAGNRVLLVIGLLDALGESLAALRKDELGLRAIIGGGGAVAAEHRQIERHRIGLSGAPAGEGKLAIAALCSGQRLAPFLPGIVGKLLARDPEDHIARHQHAIGR